MAESTPKATPAKKPEKEKKPRRIRWVYVVIILLLLGFNGFLFVHNQIVTKEKEEALALAQEMETLRDAAEANYQQALADLESIKQELADKGALTDSMEAELNELKAELDKILSKRAISAGQIAKARNIAKKLEAEKTGFVAQLDSLKNLTNKLLTENETLSSELGTERNKVTRLTAENQVLTSKVDMVNLLVARNMKVAGLRMKGTTESPTKKGKKVEKLKISFTLEENMIVDPGEKTMYFSIKGPKGNLRKAGVIDLKDGSGAVEYATKVQFSYNQKNINASAYYSQEGGFDAGKYRVKAFYDGRPAGEGELTLK